MRFLACCLTMSNCGLLLLLPINGLAPISRRQAFHNSIIALPTALVVTQGQEAAALEWQWNDKPKGGFPVLLNGQSNVSTDGSFVRLRYDTTKATTTAARRIVVYQRTGTAEANRLDKAMRGDLPVARVLDIGNRMGETEDEGWMNMRTATTVAAAQYTGDSDTKYYTFDLVYTPPKAESSQQAVLYYLVSAVVVRERLYAMVVECTEDERVKSKAQLDQLRASFRVQPLL